MNFQALSLKAPQNCAIRSPRKGSRAGEESGWGSISASCACMQPFLSRIEDAVCRNWRNDAMRYHDVVEGGLSTGSPSSAMIRSALVVGQGPGFNR